MRRPTENLELDTHPEGGKEKIMQEANPEGLAQTTSTEVLASLPGLHEVVGILRDGVIPRPMGNGLHILTLEALGVLKS